MTEKQINKLRMYCAVSAICENNEELWLENESFTEGYRKFSLKIPQIQKIRDLLTIELVAGNTLKSLERIEIEEMVFYISGKIASFAKETGNEELLHQIHIHRSNLDKVSNMEIARISETVINQALENLNYLSVFGITYDLIEQFQNLLGNFITNLNNLKHWGTKVQHTSDHLKKLFREADELLKSNLDEDIEFFRKRYPDFYEQYKASRQIPNIEYVSEYETERMQPVLHS